MPTASSLRPPVRLTTLLAASTLAVGVAGCGGDDETTTTPATSTSAATTQTAPATSGDVEAAFKARYQELRPKLNAITQRLGTALETADEQSNAQIAQTLGGVERDLGAGVDELKRLTPTPGLSADFGSLTRTADAIVGDLGDIVSAARTGDPAAAKTATRRLVGRIPTLRSATTAITSNLGLSAPGDGGSGTTGGTGAATTGESSR